MKTASILTALLVGIGTAAMAQEGGRRPGGPGAGRGPGGPGGRGELRRPMPLIVALDRDHNGEISAQEIAGAAEALKTLDRNSDGKLTPDELHPQGGPGAGPRVEGGPGGGEGAPGRVRPGRGEGEPRRGPGGPRGEGEPGAGPERPGRPGGPGGMPIPPVLAALDTDRDGELSAREIASAPAALKTLDKNSDGKLTHEELRPPFGPGNPGAGRRGQGGPEGRPGEGRRPGRPEQE